MENFTKNDSPLFEFLTKHCESIWNSTFQKAFETLKENIYEAPILRGPNWKLHFHISTNVSYRDLGVVLGQKYLVSYAIYYTRKNMTPLELNYIVTKRSF